MKAQEYFVYCPDKIRSLPRAFPIGGAFPARSMRLGRRLAVFRQNRYNFVLFSACRKAHFDVPFAQLWFYGFILRISILPAGCKRRSSTALVVFCMHFHPFVLSQYNLSFLVV